MRSNEKGAILFETVLLVSLLCWAFFLGFIKIQQEWNQKLDDLQTTRLEFDGVRK